MPEKTFKMFKTLGEKVSEFQGFDTFPAPKNCQQVTMKSDEVTALCPVTGQPDWYTVTIRYAPNALCLESKSLKLYLQGLRNAGIFCESLADRICDEIGAVLKPRGIEVQIRQKPRGGIEIVTRSSIGEAF